MVPPAPTAVVVPTVVAGQQAVQAAALPKTGGLPLIAVLFFGVASLAAGWAVRRGVR